MQHSIALKWILRYLAGTKNFSITYSKNASNTDGNIFHGFADAAYANNEDNRSTSGYMAAGGAITWRFKKQTTIALSSTEAEYVALSEAGREVCWLRNLLFKLGYSQNSPTLVKGNNDGSIMMAHNPQLNNRSKHIGIRWHWVRDLVEHNILTIQSCRDPEQTADALMKALPNINDTFLKWA